MDFGQGKFAMMPGRISASTSGVGRPGFSITRDVELALLRIGLDLRLLDRGQPGALQEALDRRLGRADARAFALLAHVLPLHGQARDVQRQPARRRKGLGALIEEAALDQRVGDELLQVLRRAALHAGRDFFGEEFEEEIGHCASSLPLWGGAEVGVSAPAPFEL